MFSPFSGDQDVKVPVTQTRKLANMLARHVKLTTLQENGPWYNGFQVYHFANKTEETKFIFPFCSAKVNFRNNLTIFHVFHFNHKSFGCYFVGWRMESSIWEVEKRKKYDIFDVCNSKGWSSYGAVYIPFRVAYTFQIIYQWISTTQN